MVARVRAKIDTPSAQQLLVIVEGDVLTFGHAFSTVIFSIPSKAKVTSLLTAQIYRPDRITTGIFNN